MSKMRSRILTMSCGKCSGSIDDQKWAIRNLAHEYGYNITFAPKITVGKAGSGLHVHMRIMKNGKNQMLANGILSETARQGYRWNDDSLASSITAFGNTNPTSYFRLVPHQEAPTNICWGRSESFSFSSCSARLGRKNGHVCFGEPIGTCQPL